MGFWFTVLSGSPKHCNKGQRIWQNCQKERGDGYTYGLETNLQGIGCSEQKSCSKHSKRCISSKNNSCKSNITTAGNHIFRKNAKLYQYQICTADSS